MARFSEEEVLHLQCLVSIDLDTVNESWGKVWAPEMVPFLVNLLDKLQNYQNKHYPEDVEDA